jgi:hypothetical protein
MGAAAHFALGEKLLDTLLDGPDFHHALQLRETVVERGSPGGGNV